MQTSMPDILLPLPAILQALKSRLIAWSLPGLLIASAAAAPAQTPVFSFLGSQTTVATTVGNGILGAQGLALDAAGDIFIADTGNNRVLEIPLQNGALNSSAQTVLVSGLNGPSGLALDAQGNLFIADTGNNRVAKLPLVAGSYSAALLSSVGVGFSSPEGLAFDNAGNLYVADTGNNRVVVLSIAQTQTTVGTGLSAPSGVAVDAQGDVFVAEFAAKTVVEIPNGGGAQTTVVSGAIQPGGIALDAAKNLILADVGGNRVVKITPQGGQYNSANLAVVDTLLSSPGGLAISNSPNGTNFSVYISDLGNGRVVRFATGPISFNAAVGAVSAPATALVLWNQPGTLKTALALTYGALNKNFVQAPGGSCASGTAFQPGDTCSVNLTFAPSNAGSLAGALLFGDSAMPTPNLLNVELVGVGTGPGLLLFPGQQTVLVPPTGSTASYNALGITVDGLGNVYVADPFNGSGVVVEIPPGGANPGTLGTGLSRPFGVAIDAAGNLFIADTFNRRIVELPVGGGAQVTVASGFTFPTGVATDAAGNLYVADSAAGKVYVLPVNGGARTTIGTGLHQPSGVAVDANGNVFISDAGASSIIEVPANGGPQTTVGSGLQQPGGVAVDHVGNVYVADTFNNRLILFPPSGAPFTVGNGLSQPNAVTVDQASNIYIADTNNGRVLEVNPSVAQTIVFPATIVGATSKMQIVLQSSGTAPLTLTSLSVQTVAGGNFTLDPSSSCAANTPLATGQTCILVIDFTPQNGGTNTGSLVLSNNAPGSPQTIALSGLSTDPVASFTIVGPTKVVYADDTRVYTTTALDARGQVDTSYNATLTVLVSGSLTSSLQVTFVNGVVTTPLASLVPGTYTFTLMDGTAKASITTVIVRSDVTITSTPPQIGYGQSGPIPVVLDGQFHGNGYTHPGGTLNYSVDGIAQTRVLFSAGNASLPVPTSLSAGTHTLAISYPGDSNYNPGTATFTFTIVKGPQTISFAPLASVVYGAPPLTLRATSTSGLPIVFSVIAGPGKIAGSTLTILGAGNIIVEADQPGNNNYLAAAPAQQTILVQPAPLSVKITGTTIVFGAARPSAYPTQVTGLVNGDTVGTTLGLSFAYTPAAAPIPAVGSYSIGASLTGAAAANYTLTVVPGTLVVTQAIPSISLSSSQLNAPLNTPVTFTATVATGNAGAATGLVTFFDGSFVIGTAPVTASSASITTSILAVGTHIITASYGGDGNFLPATSAQLTETISSPGYNITGAASSLSITQGQSGVIAYTLNPTGSFKGTITFSCAGLPIWASCSFAPPTLAADGSGAPLTTTMTIITLGPNHGTIVGRSMVPAKPGSPGGFEATGISLAGLAWLAPAMLLGVLAYNRKRRKIGTILFLALLLSVAMGSLSGCGFKQPTVPVGTYSVTVTATTTSAAGAFTRTLPLKLTVTP